jgi:hypothetical protein
MIMAASAGMRAGDDGFIYIVPLQYVFSGDQGTAWKPFMSMINFVEAWRGEKYIDVLKHRLI